MELLNFDASHFFGIIIFFGILGVLISVFFDGLGYIKDMFYTSFRRR